jgi:hypothetical protein
MTYLGCLALPTLAMFLAMAHGFIVLLVFGVIGFLIALVMGCWVAETIARRQAPVWLKRFREKEGKITLRFDNERYLDEAVRELNQRIR